MSRTGKLLVVALVVSGLSLSYWVGAQQPAPRTNPAPLPRPSAPAAQGGQAAPEAEPAFPNIPSYYLLGMEQVQNDLKLTDQQKQQIQQLTDAYTQESQQELQTLRELPPNQRQAKLAAAQQRSMQRIETLRQRLEGMLQPKQLEQVRQIAFRMAVPNALSNPSVLGQLQVSEKQKQQLEQIRQQTQQKAWQLEQDMGEQSFQVLTPPQQKALREMSKGQGS
jgi:hypothetical protein